MPRVPLFPLGTVVFPGSVTPLHVFEDRYVALVEELLAETDETQRVFGIVAIREGYEVTEGFLANDAQPRRADSHQVASAYRVGTLVQLTSVERLEGGRYQVEVTGRQRFRVGAVDPTGPFLRGEVTPLPDTDEPGAEDAAALARERFAVYRSRLSVIRGGPVLVGRMPDDPAYLSYSLAATCLLTLPQRQQLLETETARARLELLDSLLRDEARVMAAIPSLPATELARTRWHPN